MVKKALLIGINYKGTNSELKGCENDVHNIHKFVKDDCGFKDAEITIMTESQPRTNLKPTRSNITTQIREFVKNNKTGDELFFHYSGHGCYTRDGSGDEEDGRDETICPLDYSSAGQITDDELRKILVDPIVEGARLTALCDCCHSCSLLDLKFTADVSLIPNESSTYTIKNNKKVAGT